MKQQTTLHVFTDGGSRGNPGQAGIGIYIETEDGNMLFEHGERIGIKTNNFAEYTAVIRALEWIYSQKELLATTKLIKFFLDSQLVVQQVNSVYRVKSEDLKPLLFTIREKQAYINLPIRYSHVPREQNKKADRMVNLALDNKI